MRARLLPMLAAALLMAGVAWAGPSTPATHYRWTDAAGVVHFGDTIPASALPGGYDIVDNDGRVVRHINRELTPAERKQAAIAASRAAAAKRAAQQRNIADAQLLAAYPTATALAASQQGQLLQIQADIKTLQTNLRSQEDSLTQLLGHAADLEHTKRPIPPYLNKRIADQRQAVNSERSALTARRADLAAAQAKFAAQLKHYDALRAKFGNTDQSDP